MVYRIYVEKKKQFANEAASLLADLRTLLGIDALEGLRIINRYDVEDIEKELFEKSKNTVFAEPQVDDIYDSLPEGGDIFAVEYLPGQFDQRADSAAQCIQIISRGMRPTVRTARVYILDGKLTDNDIEKIKSYVINAVEAREASLDMPKTLRIDYEIPQNVAILDGFIKLDRGGLEEFISDYGLAMDIDDIAFCQDYFIKENRDPTITEIRVIDTYWSDHCRHTTFGTILDDITFDDPLIQKTYENYLKSRSDIGRKKPVTLMDMGTIAVKLLKANGLLQNLDESEEINACTVKIDVNHDGKTEKWLLLFKNETHNHPTEIEPFGGAATCIGGAIRDPLSGRSYVYAAMRLTGAADPLTPISETLEGKLPQRKIVTTAAGGYSSYGNQIGLATCQVDEFYHPGYAAKHLEVGAVIAAAPAENVRRERPAAGDKIILLGGRTGRDGCGGATGSSKSHTASSLETCGAEVQKGNAPEERKLQRLFRNPEASRLIKRCNDFGAGGVSVAIGELADGLQIDLDKVPKKYDGLDGTELAISESQERMAVVVEANDAARFMELADTENLESTIVAVVKNDRRLTMTWRGAAIVDISRDFLDSNGAEKHITAHVAAPKPYEKKIDGTFEEKLRKTVSDLNVCSKRGLTERFDSTVGAGTVLMPYGGRHQLTPIQAMVNKISVEHGDTDTCSVMSWGYNPDITSKSPYHGAYLAVIESVSKLAAAGADMSDVYLSFQEYFPKLGKNSEKWGLPAAALLGAYRAQTELKIAAIGGKDSMSGSFEDLDVPPTLISFAVATGTLNNIVSPEFKRHASPVRIISPKYGSDGLPEAESLKEVYKTVSDLIKDSKVRAVYTPTYGGIAEAIAKMCFGNMIGFKFDDNFAEDDIFAYNYGSFILELTEDCNIGTVLGETIGSAHIIYSDAKIKLSSLLSDYESKLESVYRTNIGAAKKDVPIYSFASRQNLAAAVKSAKPKALIPVFPGTNCEYDTAKAITEAGGDAEIFIVRNLTADAISSSAREFAERVRLSQMIVIPGGFSGGDEPDGSGKFITAFFRNPEIKDAVTEMLDSRGGLMCGICNGFQALIKLGLVPYGRITDTDASMPTLTFNEIGRHQSKLVRTRIVSNKSPWLKETKLGDIYTVPISHGEGRFIADEATIKDLAAKGQIITQYVDLNGVPTDDILFNPNGSMAAIEGITSPDGRILGKMGHNERIGNGLYKNVIGNYDMGLFRSAVKYFK